jgi:hypothetical protein
MPRPFNPLNPLSSGSGTLIGPEGPVGPPGPPANIPVYIQLFSGDKSSPESSPVRFGAANLELSPFPLQNSSGLTRRIRFIANLEVTNPLAVGTVRLRNVDENEIVTGSELTTSNPINTEKQSVALTVGTNVGDLKNNRTYEVAGFITGGNPEDAITVTNAKLEIFYV